MNPPDTPTIPLGSFQTWMQQMLLDPHQQTEVDPYTMLPAGLAPEIGSVVKDSARLGAAEHLAIYQRSYIARLRHVMAQQFSAVAYALGEDLFRGFADMYLADHPSHSYNLAHLGDAFEAYLQAQRPDRDAAQREDWIDFVVELVQLEGLINRVFDMHAPEDFPLATDRTDPARLRLVPTAQLLAHAFPATQFYSAFKRGQEPPLPHPQPSWAILFRHQYRLALYPLLPEQHQFLTYLNQGATYPQATQRLASECKLTLEAVSPYVEQWRATWLSYHFFAAS